MGELIFRILVRVCQIVLLNANVDFGNSALEWLYYFPMLVMFSAYSVFALLLYVYAYE